MAFDAGTIDAKLVISTDDADKDLAKFQAKVKKFEDEDHTVKIKAVPLTIDPRAFDASMAVADAKVRKFEDEPHKVKIAAEFDDGSMDRARKLFADLDNAISKDAMDRLKSSPQGSVLGSLNALFSPHPITGAPSPSQSAEGGLLGKMLNPQTSGGEDLTGGSSPLGSALSGAAGTTDNIRQNLTGTQPGDVDTTDQIRQALTGQGATDVDTTDSIRQALTGTGASDVDTTDSIRQALTGQGATDVDTTDSIRQALTGQGATNTTTTDDIKQALVGQGAQNTTTTDDIKQALTGTGASDTTTTDKIVQSLTGTGATDTTTTDTVKEKLDKASETAAEAEAGASGDRAGTSFMGMFTSHIKNLLPKAATDDLQDKSEESGDSAGQALGSGLLSGMGPSILGVGAKDMFGKLVLIAVGGLSVLPALAGIIGTGMGVAMVGGLLAVAISGNAKLKAQFSGLGGDFKTVIAAAAAPIIPVISGVLGQLPALIEGLQAPLAGIFKTIGPQIQGVFAGLKPIITGLLGVMQAAAPAFGPFIGALEELAGNLFPGIATVVKATIPFISQLAGILGSLGGNLGALFAAAAPAVGASMKILGGLLDLIGGLLPVIMKLADIFAVTLAPVFTAFAGVVQTLLGPLTTIGGVIAQFAGAVIGDLAGAFGAVATLITAIGPGLGVLAQAFGSLFTVLENAGVFALVGDALENLAPTIGRLIALLVTDLAPILPTIVGLFSQMLTIVVSLATDGLGVLLRVLTSIVGAMPIGLVQTLVGGFIALKLAMMGFEGVGAIFTAITAAVTAMSGALDLDTIALTAMYAWETVISIATKAWAAAQAILDAAMDANPIGLIILAVAALGTAVYLLVANWSAVWGTIKTVTEDAWQFIDNILHNGIVNDILLIVAPLAYLALNWQQTWAVIQTVGEAIWTWLSDVFGTDLSGFFTKTIPGWWDTTVAAAKTFATDTEDAVKDIWTWLSTTFGTDVSDFFTKTIPGYWDTAVADAKMFATDTEDAVKAIWTWLSGTLGPDVSDFFTKTIPGYWDTAVDDAKAFATDTEDAVKAIWTWLSGTFGPDISDLFTKTLPGYWTGFYNAVVATGATILGWFKGVPAGIINAMAGFGTVLLNFGTSVMDDFLDGFKSIYDDVINFFEGIPGDILKALGIGSPPDWAIDAGEWIIKGIGIGMSQAQSAVTKAAKLVAGGAYTTLAGAAGQIQALAKQMAAAKGWVGPLWNDLNAVEMLEAGWNPNAVNAASGAYGIAQFIGGPSEYAQYGGNSTTVAGQITGMLNYIAQRYGNPAAALLHEEAFHWYGLGGPINEPVLGYGVNSGDRYVFGESGPEYVTPGRSPDSGSSAAMLARLDALIAATRQIPAGVGDQVGGAVGGAAQAASFRSRYPRGGA